MDKYVCDLGVGKKFIKTVKKITKENTRKMSAVDVAMYIKLTKYTKETLTSQLIRHQVTWATDRHKSAYRLWIYTAKRVSLSKNKFYRKQEERYDFCDGGQEKMTFADSDGGLVFRYSSTFRVSGTLLTFNLNILGMYIKKLRLKFTMDRVI